MIREIQDSNLFLFLASLSLKITGKPIHLALDELTLRIPISMTFYVELEYGYALPLCIKRRFALRICAVVHAREYSSVLKDLKIFLH